MLLANVSLEGLLILVGLLDVDGAVLKLVDLETDVAGLLADVDSHVGDSVLDELLLAREGLHSSVKSLNHFEKYLLCCVSVKKPS